MNKLINMMGLNASVNLDLPLPLNSAVGRQTKSSLSSWRAKDSSALV